MPHITIDYAPQLAEALDLRVLVSELHPLVLERTRSGGVCKTLCRPAAQGFVGEHDRVGFVHLEVGLLPGRSEALKAELAEELLELLGKHLVAGAAGEAVASVEVRDLGASYRLAHSW